MNRTTNRTTNRAASRTAWQHPMACAAALFAALLAGIVLAGQTIATTSTGGGLQGAVLLLAGTVALTMHALNRPGDTTGAGRPGPAGTSEPGWQR